MRTTNRPKYLSRLVDANIDDALSIFGAIELSGPMWCGKTMTALQHSQSSINLSTSELRANVELDTSYALNGSEVHTIDEWQFVPAVWDQVRHYIDVHGRHDRKFILTGSSAPLEKGLAKHSGTGRIARVRMRPLSLQESLDSSAKISLAGLFEGEFTYTKSQANLESLAHCAVRGGFPELLEISNNRYTFVMQEYLNTLCRSQNEESPAPQNELAKFIRALARNIGSAPKLKTLADDVYPSGEMSDETKRRNIHEMLAFFENRYIIEETGGWDAPIKSKSRLRTKPRFDFCDPSLICAALGVNEKRLLENSQLFGQIFEQMALRDLRIYTDRLGFDQMANIYYYRDNTGLEVDAIIELSDGRWAAIEIKTGTVKAEDGIKNLRKLVQKVAENPMARNLKPSFMMVLVGVGQHTLKTEDGIYIVPLDTLGA